MKKLLYILLFIPSFSFSQVNQDSLWNIWEDESKHDTVRLEAINDIIIKGGYMVSKQDSALILSKLQYLFAQKKHQKSYISYSLNKIAALSFQSSNYEEALDYFKQSLSISNDLRDSKSIANDLRNIGFTYQKLGNYNKALEFCLEASKKHKEIKDFKGLAGSYNIIGNICRYQGNNSLAIEYYTKSLQICEENNYKKELSTVLNNIGVIYRNQKENSKAIEYYKKSLELKKEIGKRKGVAISLNNIGELYISEKSYTKAIDFFKQSIKIKDDLGDRIGIAASLNNIGIAYFENNKSDSALFYLSKSLKIREDINDKKGTSMTLNDIGKVYLKENKFLTAKEYSETSFQIANKIGDIEEITETSEVLWKIYKKIGNYEKSLLMYETYISSRDSIVSQNNKKEIIRQQFKYYYEKKEAISDAEHKSEVENQKTIALAEQKQQNIIIVSVCIVLVLVTSFLAYIFKRLKIIKKQRNKIYRQKEIIENTNIETEKQKLVIEEAHTEIQDSINYAKRLQDAILPSLEEMNEFLPNNFLYFKPKDIVSGDFYWFENINGVSYLAVADCTGHGVPGAMVSVVCSNALNRAVKEFGIKEPSKILDKTRELVIETFAKNGKDVQDGMDIALCAFIDNKVIFSGANNPLWIVRNTSLISNEKIEARISVIGTELSLIEFKANKQPIGLYQNMTNFNQIEIELFENDKLYLFTDGYADQFGGEKGKKFKYKPFKELLLSIYEFSMEEQQNEIDAHFKTWKGTNEQLDDVCVIGVMHQNQNSDYFNTLF